MACNASGSGFISWKMILFEFSFLPFYYFHLFHSFNVQGCKKYLEKIRWINIDFLSKVATILLDFQKFTDSFFQNHFERIASLYRDSNKKKKLFELKCEEKVRELKISLINQVCKKDFEGIFKICPRETNLGIKHPFAISKKDINDLSRPLLC